MTKSKGLFNTIDYWNRFRPNMLPLNYSILTDKESNAEMAPIAGIASYQQDKLNIFMMMNNFIIQ